MYAGLPFAVPWVFRKRSGHDDNGKQGATMAQTEGQQRASDAVAAWMAARGWNNAQLVDAAGIDAGTVGDFLAGKRWPKIGTQGKIERALGWPAGILQKVARGDAPAPIALAKTAAAMTVETTMSGTSSAPVGGGIDPEVLVELASLDPNSVARVKDFIRGIKAGG